ncbi:hypothetical protein [Streptomyces phaeochromogenes]|uniref:hypothetical protein n=1 Tax=Streptomyces phaeochromogenes TaxID=1923 RepID=UPI002DDC0072|nr:hypothetical protein [Streptomyces phaeochromogenes]WRZ34596.1 hypothetical protein OG931_46125 [Streptomyces phaeochromogenes]
MTDTGLDTETVDEIPAELRWPRPATRPRPVRGLHRRTRADFRLAPPPFIDRPAERPVGRPRRLTRGAWGDDV